MTDLEFYEIRYSGTAASVVRGFRAIYLGPAVQLHDHGDGESRGLQDRRTSCSASSAGRRCSFVGLLNVAFAAHSGLWGVLVIDMIQFFIKMTAVIAAAYFALQAPQVGGLTGLIDKLSVMRGPDGVNYLNVLPDFTNNWDIAVAVFIMPIAVQWWAVWYPGAEPGGGSYIAQRMLASKVREGCARRGAVLQRRALRAAAVAVDPGRARRRSSSIRSSPTSSARFRISIRACSATTSPIRRC